MHSAMHVALSQSSEASFLYYAAFSLYLIGFVLNNTAIERVAFIETQQIYIALRIVSIVLIIIMLALRKYSADRLLVFLSAVGIAAISTVLTGDWNLLILVFFAGTAQNVRVRNLAKIVLCVHLVILAVAYCGHAMGYLLDSNWVRKDNGFSVVRSAFGFSHPNQFGLSIVSVCLSYSIIQYPNFRFRTCILYAISFLVCFFFAASRTSAIAIVVLALTSFCMSNYFDVRWKSLFAKVAALLFVAMTVFSIYGMIYYDESNSLMHGLNQLLANRIALANHFFLSNPITLFGSNFDSNIVPYGEYDYFVVDNGYAHFIIQYGFVPSFLFLMTYLLTMLHLSPVGDGGAILIGLFVCAVIAIGEWSAFQFAINFTLIGVAYIQTMQRQDTRMINAALKAESSPTSDSALSK